MAALVQQQCAIKLKIEHAAQSKRVRFNEFFKDFDRLRTGEITESQFKRCINQSFGLTVSEGDFNDIKKRFGSSKKSGMINYREFVNGLQADKQEGEIGSEPAIDVTSLLKRLRYHYDFRGIVLSDCFEDFDRHNSGLVTDSQFWRCFPSAPGMADADIARLIDTYRNSNTNLISYIKFQQDLEKLPAQDADEAVAAFKHVTFPLEHTSPEVPIQKLLEKVQLRVYKDGIRTTEFFIDHDKLRSGFITKNQFIIGLNLICGMSRCPLSREGIERIAQHYIGPDGRVCYRKFCFFMENAFNVPHLEKNPTATVYRPPVGALGHTENTLNPLEEEQVQNVLDILRDFVTRRRITMLYPFFKDFDRGKLFSRGVTKAQFRRLLNFFDVDLSEKDCDLICRKFEEPNGTDVNYPAFVQAIDKDYIDLPEFHDKKSDKGSRSRIPLSPKLQPELVNIPKLIERLQCEVKVYRVRVCEHFKDFDGLKSGSISKSLFKRGLASMQGNHYNLTPSELEAICLYYQDPKVGGSVRWSAFEQDIERVITEQNLEKRPTFRVKNTDHITINSCNQKTEISESEREIGNVAIRRMREKIAQRRIMTKPCFQDFDRHNCGYVNPTQFAQGLTYLGLETNETERTALMAMYGDVKGINFHKFFKDLDPVVGDPPKYENNLSEMVRYIKFREDGTDRLLTKDGCKTVEAVIDKIKELVMKRRIRLLEFFKDYDKLKSGRILRSNFKRALDLGGLGLNVDEIDLLAQKYKSVLPGKEDCVYYHHFNDEIESIFTVKGLEKSPTAQVFQYKIMPEWLKNNLSKPIQEVYNAAMEHLARFVKTRRMQLYPMFEDYDKCRNGTVTYSQFRRVLSILCLIADEVEFHALEQQYTVNVGGMNVFNYLAFCDDIYAIAKLDKLD